MKGEARLGTELQKSRLFQSRIVIVVDVVVADHGAAGGEQMAREAKADEACRSGDEDGIGRGVGHWAIGIGTLRTACRC